MATNEVRVTQSTVSTEPLNKAQLPTILSLVRGRTLPLFFSLSDQALSVGGMFLANVLLARVRTKEEYGLFALSYSIFTFIMGIHNAAILEPFTVLGSGRYHSQFTPLARLMWRSNTVFCTGLSAILLGTWLFLRWLSPALASPALLGMALACGILLTGAFVRRAFYIERNPGRAARFSLLFFLALVILLVVAVRGQWLTSLTTFLVAAAAWAIATLVFRKLIPGRDSVPDTPDYLPGYGAHHWQYARWVLATAFVFQLMNQGYYWIVAGFLSVKDVAGLRAMHLLVVPVDQVFTALNLLILPMMAVRFATGQHRELTSLWFRFTISFLVVTAVFATAVHLFSHSLLHFIYGGKFDDLAAMLGLMVLVPVIMGIGNSTNAVLKSIERPNSVFFAYVMSGFVTIAVGIPLVMHFHLRGAVYGMLASAATYTLTLITIWFAQRDHFRACEPFLAP